MDEFIQLLNQRYEESGCSFSTNVLVVYVLTQKYHYWLSVFQHENAYENYLNRPQKLWQSWRIGNRLPNLK